MILFLVGLVVGIIGGAVGSYLILRNNPKIKSKIDDAADNIDGK